MDSAGVTPVAPGLSQTTVFGLFVALCVAQVGSLFAADAWNNITFTAGEVRKPQRNVPLSLALGAILVIGLYMLANVAYVLVLPLDDVQTCSFGSRGCRDAGSDLSQAGRRVDGPRHHDLGLRLHQRHADVRRSRLLRHGADGLFFRRAANLNRSARSRRFAGDARSLGRGAGADSHLRSGHPRLRQSVQQSAGLRGLRRASVLHPDHRGCVPLRWQRPDAERPYRALGYPIVPLLYIVSAAVILTVLFVYRPATTFPGMVIVLIGIPVYFAFRWSSRRASP